MAHIKNASTILSKGRTHSVARFGPTSFVVTSGTSGNTYAVHAGIANAFTCTCDWGKHRPADDTRSACSHVMSVIAFAQAEQATKVKAFAVKAQAQKTHRKMVDIGDGVTMTLRRQGA